MSDDLLLSLPDDESPTPAGAPASAEAHALAARGEWAGAERLFDQLRAAAARAGDDIAHAVALTNRGQALARLGRLEEAALMLDAALEARRRLHASGLAGEAVIARGIADVAAVAAALGDVSEAARLLRRARAHAVGGGAADVVLAIDERLAAARALGASDDEEAVLAAEPELGALALPVEESTFEVAGLGALALELPAYEAPTSLDAPVDVPESVDSPMDLVADDSLDVLPPVASLDDELVDDEPLDEEPVDVASLTLDGFEPTGLDFPAFEAPPEEPLRLDAPSVEASALDEHGLDDALAEDAWSLADPAPFDGLDAEAVHTRAVELETSHADHAAELALEPTALGTADAQPLPDEEPDPVIPPAPVFPEVYESPLAAAEPPAPPASAEPSAAAPAPAPRRRTTRDVPALAPPEQKRPWWRRLTSRS